MNAADIIDKISILYRMSNKITAELNRKKEILEQELFYAKQDNFYNISHADFESLTFKIKELETKIKDNESYCRGIFDTRELFFNSK